MTNRQLQWLLLTEGLLHAALLTVILLPVTFLVTWFGMPVVFSQLNTWCMTYHYALAPLWLALPLMLLLAVAVPLMCCRFIEKEALQSVCGLLSELLKLYSKAASLAKAEPPFSKGTKLYLCCTFPVTLNW